MAEIYAAANQLANRPDEEHFPDISTLIGDAARQKARSSVLAVDDRKVFFHEDGVDLGGHEVRLTNYSAAQLGTLSGVGSSILQKLTPRTMAQVMNETFPRDHNGEDARRWLVESEEGSPTTVRAITSASYSRLWDADLYNTVDRWLSGSDWGPALPEINSDGQGTNIKGNTKPALFRSDRDSFAFFMGPREEDGGTFGGLRKGLYCWNSEVGHKSFGYSSFYFRGMCANFIIWEASSVQTRRARHTRQVERVFSWFGRELRRIAQPMTTSELDAFDRATRVPFQAWTGSSRETAEQAAEKLYRLPRVQLTQGQARASVRAAIEEERNQAPAGVAGSSFLSAWDVANGITWAAKDLGYQADRTAMQAAAGQLLTLAAAGKL